VAADPATWLAWPTLRIGGGQTKTAGVHFHAGELRRVLAVHGSLVMAELRIETAGQYAGAVRVFVAGVMLGSVPHDVADKYREVVVALDAAGLSATCRAELEAGEFVNVWLDARPEWRPADDPFLPPLSPFYVRLAANEAERLDAGLNSKAKSKRFVTTGRMDGNGSSWELELDDAPVGTVIDPPSRPLDAARAAGFPLTCQVRVLREVGKPLRVMVDLPPAR
jgi:hypothetical protein